MCIAAGPSSQSDGRPESLSSAGINKLKFMEHKKIAPVLDW